MHGGEKFVSSVLVSDEVIATLEECSDLAPLHNPAGLIGIRASLELMPTLQLEVTEVDLQLPPGLGFWLFFSIIFFISLYCYL